jgi:hypothetical protein
MISSIVSFVTFSALAFAAPVVDKRYSDYSPEGKYFPLANGFPNPSNDQVMKIQNDAFGTLPNGAPPKNISAEGITNLKLIAFNELMEVAFFTELLYNLTNKAPGYDLGYGHQYVLDALNAIVNQEQLHALNANGALKKFETKPIEPCKYQFPVTDFQSAIALAATFTDVVLGTLQDANQVFAQNGDNGLVRAVSSVIGNEGEQEGFFRLVGKKRPSSQPFLTTSTRDFAFTAIQSFTIPKSCPSLSEIPLKTFKPLNVLSQNIQPATQNLKFSFSAHDVGSNDWGKLDLVYINQQNTPVIKRLQNLHREGDVVNFEAAFPFDEFLMNGLTIAAVTKTQGPFANAKEVSDNAILGPGIIEIN